MEDGGIVFGWIGDGDGGIVVGWIAVEVFGWIGVEEVLGWIGVEEVFGWIGEGATLTCLKDLLLLLCWI